MRDFWFRVSRGLSKSFAGILGAIVGFMAVVETIYSPTTDSGKCDWLIFFASLMSLATLVVLVIQAYHEDIASDAKESEERERDEQHAKVQTSVQAALDKVGARLANLDPRLGLAATAYKLADDMMSFLKNQGAAPPRVPNLRANILRVIGAQMTLSPEGAIQERYRSTFDTQVAQMIAELRARGVIFHHEKDDFYLNLPSPMIGNQITAIATELRDAATSLVANAK